MRAQFEYWLLNYKEYKNAKAQNTIKTINALSDEAVLNSIIAYGLFCCESFIQYAKFRQSITRARALLPAEKPPKLPGGCRDRDSCCAMNGAPSVPKYSPGILSGWPFPTHL